MKPTKENDSYPIFEANQVLSYLHLNQVFNYLDEQERLTRANLIGIGIVCGLEIRFDPKKTPTTIYLSKGCGVTSEGYLIVEPQDVSLVSYREYTLPSDPDYLPFKDKSAKQYPMWELFQAGEPDTMSLDTAPKKFLSDKAVLLFLELKKEALRTCSPNNCDDKGSKITATVRRLLISIADLDKIIAASGKLGSGLSSAELADALTAKLGLPDIRLPRFDVPNTVSATSINILAAFHAVFKTNNLVSDTAKALIGTYEAFKPVLLEKYTSNPFNSFSADFGFLETAPKTSEQVRFLQYYYDFFDDLINAYNEFRWKGAELMCACCPPDGLFPRHLMLGVLAAEEVKNPGIYRQQFLASPAIGGCVEYTKELKQLFQRLVEMTDSFTNAPLLTESSVELKIDKQIRITPNKLGEVPLSDKAIPYYYLQDGVPPLYSIWNFERTRRNRANQNLSYHSDKYMPPAPAFVADALRYDLEPYNFLRIEGHLGKNYQSVLRTLLSLKNTYRLPIEIIALRTGAFDENIAVDLSKEACRFQDLEALYDTLREELLSNLCEGVMYLYDVAIVKSGLNGGTPKLALLKKYAPNYRYKIDTVGAWFEKYLASLQARPYIDIDQNKVDNNAVLTVYCSLFTGTSGLSSENFAHVVSIYYLTKLSEVLPESLDALAYADFENKYQDLIGLIRYFRSEAVTNISDELKPFIPQEDLVDHFDQVLFSCKLESVKAIHEEYERRLREVKQKQFLSFFLQKNPGIAHKAGVPIGGTFIIVYHDNPDPVKTGIDFIAGRFIADASSNRSVLSKSTGKILSGALNRLQSKSAMLADPDIQLIFGELTGQIPSRPIFSGEGGLNKETETIFTETVNGLADGTVIADFFLPYLCCSDCAPVQFVLPMPPLGLTVQLACTNSDGLAEATLTSKGGMAPFTYRLDGQPFKELQGTVLLSVGSHMLLIRDSAGAESQPQTITVPETLIIGAENYIDDVSKKTYQVGFSISGGTIPYKSESGTVAGSTFTSISVNSEEKISVTIIDNAGCKITKDFIHKVEEPCKLPCEGIALRCAYRFWMPEPDLEQDKPYTSYRVRVPAFVFEFPQGGSIDLSAEVEKIIQANPDDLNNKFNDVIKSWLNQINELIAKASGSDDWLRLEYSKSPADSIGTLWIEHFECLKFEFNILTYFSRPKVSEQFDMVYTPDGTTIRNLKITIPAFDCKQIDKCDPNRPVTDFCKEVDLNLKIIKKVESNKASLEAIPSGNDTPSAYLWEVQDGIPALSNDNPAIFSFELLQPTGKIIWLTAYTKKGCRVIAIDKIDLKPG